MEVAHLDYGQASPDCPGRVGDSQRESAESVAAGDHPGPVRMVERNRTRMPCDEVTPARVSQLKDRDIIHMLISGRAESLDRNMATASIAGKGHGKYQWSDRVSQA